MEGNNVPTTLPRTRPLSYLLPEDLALVRLLNAHPNETQHQLCQRVQTEYQPLKPLPGTHTVGAGKGEWVAS